MMELIDRYLALPADERLRFRVGRRVGYYRSLEELQDFDLRRRVDQIIDEARRSDPQEETQQPDDVDRKIFKLMENYL